MKLSREDLEEVRSFTKYQQIGSLERACVVLDAAVAYAEAHEAFEEAFEAGDVTEEIEATMFAANAELLALIEVREVPE